MSRDDLFSQQEANRRRSFWLVIGFLLFFAWVGFGGDLGLYLLTRDAAPGGYRHTVPLIGLAATLVAAGICWYSWKKGPDRVLWATGAREVIEPADDAERRLVNVVEEMAIAAGLPRPRIWVVPDDDPNAFATGLAPAGASLAVTRGLLRLLDRDELQGVVAHEMAHIRNFDIRLLTLLAAMVGAIALLSDGLGRMLRGRVGGGRRGKGGSPLAPVVLMLWVLTLVVAPVLSRLLALGVSRKREYLADATGAQLTRNPIALASALERLAAASAPTRTISRGAAHLCIVDPQPTRFADRDGALADLLATHPPIRQRISRLRAMAYQAEKTARANHG